VTRVLDRLKKRVGEARRDAARASAAAVVCSYAPRELVESFFGRVVRLSPCGSVEREAEGEKRSGPFVCSHCKAILGADTTASFLIGCSSCDQMRRALELRSRRSGEPLTIINMPATRSRASRAYFKTEVRWLAKELTARAGCPLDIPRLRKTIGFRNGIRSGMRRLRKRLGGAEWTALVLSEFLLPPAEMTDLLAEVESLPGRTSPAELKMMIAGSPLTFEDLPFLEYVESLGASIEADATCTGDRAAALKIPVAGDPIDNLANAYFDRPPCIWMRPNDGFYRWAGDIAGRRGIRAVLWRTYKNCDIWSLETERARALLGLPLLALDMTCGDAVSIRVRTRVEAFLESLR
jgi:benzoyl-CoA reductase/2-hydroxyglutaryl-CoA dehydratase subunit BcrC/BadD/HgdB